MVGGAAVTKQKWQRHVLHPRLQLSCQNLLLRRPNQ
ncbi:hypothetical protein E2C01_086664 [Portunus trituberculatus]|uniref:Uncharacterized protein n=1 Tax=Portunus trituberculatus TaxID=210409 RepID=A0A5B7JAC5_PORTR|nr:hypothetical protein [Portunus trituberculatus]